MTAIHQQHLLEIAWWCVQASDAALVAFHRLVLHTPQWPTWLALDIMRELATEEAMRFRIMHRTVGS